MELRIAFPYAATTMIPTRLAANNWLVSYRYLKKIYGRTKLATTLGGIDGSHETATGMNWRKLGHNDRTRGVVAPTTNPHLTYSSHQPSRRVQKCLR